MKGKIINVAARSGVGLIRSKNGVLAVVMSSGGSGRKRIKSGRTAVTRTAGLKRLLR